MQMLVNATWIFWSNGHLLVSWLPARGLLPTYDRSSNRPSSNGSLAHPSKQLSLVSSLLNRHCLRLPNSSHFSGSTRVDSAWPTLSLPTSAALSLCMCYTFLFQIFLWNNYKSFEGLLDILYLYSSLTITWYFHRCGSVLLSVMSELFPYHQRSFYHQYTFFRNALIALTNYMDPFTRAPTLELLVDKILKIDVCTFFILFILWKCEFISSENDELLCKENVIWPHIYW